MDAVNARLDKLMLMMGEECAQQLATEETLQKTQACLDATTGQQNPSPASSACQTPTLQWDLWCRCRGVCGLAEPPPDWTRVGLLNQHTRTVDWSDTPLMNLYQHGLKENIQLAVLMSKIEFDSLWSMQALALKAGQTIEGIRQGHTNPNPHQGTIHGTWC
ncbi:uncharacterized protein VP01_898g5 [Puccinia sorghi]|uniref:Uncharacterized protein n=1 Tax=Puccinia sorghi TaxID=27349 RepID=A0A0L6U8J1_9BASI|nr:uncharacterized protein VP01_898g5 [Puccinia sorghi]